MQNPERNWFGDRQVEAKAKTALVRGIFDSVADRYDLMNDLMSGGLHRVWKDRLVRDIRPRAGMDCLDVAGGTGDIAFRLHRKGATLTVCDINAEMLRVGRDRALDRGIADIEWVTGNAETLPFQDESFDVYTIAFGLRNVTHIDQALAEATRVLRPGGRFFCLEFSSVDEPLLGKIYRAYSDKVIPRIGQVVAKDQDSYQYLVESIRRFPRPQALAQRMVAAGLSLPDFSRLSFGVVCIHKGIKV